MGKTRRRRLRMGAGLLVRTCFAVFLRFGYMIHIGCKGQTDRLYGRAVTICGRTINWPEWDWMDGRMLMTININWREAGSLKKMCMPIIRGWFFYQPEGFLPFWVIMHIWFLWGCISEKDTLYMLWSIQLVHAGQFFLLLVLNGLLDETFSSTSFGRLYYLCIWHYTAFWKMGYAALGGEKSVNLL